MNKLVLTALAGLMLGAMGALADLSIVDVDKETNDLIPSFTIEGFTGALVRPERWASITTNGTDLVGVLPDPQSSTDVYWQKTGLSIPVSSSRYIQIHYVVNGEAFVGDAHRMFIKASNTEGSGGINIADDSQIRRTPGAHSFILDMESDPAVTYTGNWLTFRWDMWNESSLTDNAGKSITIDRIVYGNELGTFTEAYYVADVATDWTDSSAWSDGSGASAGNLYYATNSVVLETPAETASFPGFSLSLSAPQRMELMVSGDEVTTIDNLILDGGDLGIGTGSGEAKVAGQMTITDDSKLSGATDNARDLRVLAQVSGGNRLELSAPTQTIYIDNLANDFSGTWVITNGVAEFAGETAIGMGAGIQVLSNGTLRIIGDLDGTTRANTLAVTDSPNALVDLGTYDWSVISLTVGSSNVASYSTYTVAELNAIATNEVFTGTGTIYVGPPPPTTYYLQNDIPANKSVTDKEYWFDAPTGGSQMSEAAVFEGSTFDVNTWAFRSKNTGQTEIFDGILLVDEALQSSKLMVHYGGDFRVSDRMIVDAPLIIRPHRSTANGGVSITANKLDIGSAGEMRFRTLETAYFKQNLSVGTLSGSGVIEFGFQTSDTIGEWSFSTTDAASSYSGTVSLVRGQLTTGNDLVLENASLEINSGNDNSVVLDNDVVFASVSFGDVTLNDGAYTAEELNTAFATDRFHGLGSISFEAPSDTFADWAEDRGLTGDNALPETDIEPDGMNNLLEYALGGDPEVDDAATILPTQIMDGTYMSYVYTRRTDAEVRGISYDVNSSENLAVGPLTNITEEVGRVDLGTGFESVTNRVPMADKAVQFMGLKVEINE